MTENAGPQPWVPFACKGAVVAILLIGLTGCMAGGGGGPAAPAVAVTPQVAVTAADLVGNWGLASYRQEADRERTEKQAKASCSNPYKIGAGSNGGVLMHLADQKEETEIYLKTASDGRVFLGPKGPAGVGKDSQVDSFNNGVLVTKFVDPNAASRYGIMIYVRCGTKKA